MLQPLRTWIREPNLEWLRSWAGVPIIYDDNIFGFLCLDSSIPGSLTEAVADRLKAFAAHAATAMHKADLYTRLSEEHGRLGVLYEISRSVSTSLDPGEIQDQLIEASIRATNAVAGVVYERNQKGTGVSLSARSLFSRKAVPLLKKTECQSVSGGGISHPANRRHPFAYQRRQSSVHQFFLWSLDCTNLVSRYSRCVRISLSAKSGGKYLQLPVSRPAWRLIMLINMRRFSDGLQK